MINILLIEPQARFSVELKNLLQSRGYSVLHAVAGATGVCLFRKYRPEVVLLEVVLRGTIGGFEVVRKIRAIDKTVPILLFSERHTIVDILTGFEAGANDYLRKPFHIDELAARIVALLKLRNQFNPVLTRYIGKYVFIPSTQILQINNHETKLSFRESEILVRLYDKRNDVLPRKEILDEFWATQDLYKGRSLDVFMCKLRKYLKHDPSIEIVNIRKVGYQMRIHN
ncbi:response regulator transcription factor [Sphingobacterium sp. LRF_L2]|uniref:response regulator transcription factor n=1 Tax=Sphingobacterium sp. LRF_L2 TaxID=3369421 RepID=UPI003F640351